MVVLKVPVLPEEPDDRGNLLRNVRFWGTLGIDDKNYGLDTVKERVKDDAGQKVLRKDANTGQCQAE